MKFPLAAWQSPHFALGEEVSACLPITPRTCTVLGYPVTSHSPLWRELTWESVAIDGNRAGWQYLHVSAKNVDGDDVRYRVRPKFDIGDTLKVRPIGKGVVRRIEVAGLWGGQWHWRVTIVKEE